MKDNAVAEALERLAALATPGPLRVSEDAIGDLFICGSDGRYVFEIGCPDDPHTRSDADLICTFWNNLPTIIAALKAQRVDEGGVS